MSQVKCSCCGDEFNHARDFAEKGKIEGTTEHLGDVVIWISCGKCKSTQVFKMDTFFAAMFKNP